MKKIFVAIDGSNFYHQVKRLGLSHLIKFNYQGLAKKVAGKNKIINCCFYIGQIREELKNPKSRKLKKDQDRLFASLRKQKIEVKTGYILKSDKEYHEKGVDVQIAVDICMKAVRNEYDRLVLVSSDTDLIPALREIKVLKKEVEYVGFDFSPSFALIRFSDSTTLLKKEDLLPFTKKSKQ